MPDFSLQSHELQQCLTRMQHGDPAALDELLRHVCGRLEKLARHLLRAHPAVHRWSDTGDVLQGALLRLTRALASVQPANVREFFALATQQIRRELIDLARHHYGPLGEGANHASASSSLDCPDQTQDAADLTDWTAIHEQIDRLPEEEREVVDLLFYQGLPQGDAAHVLSVTIRTVQRRWHSALIRLHRALKDETPAS